MASTKNTIAGYGLSFGIVAALFGGLTFVMNTLGLVRNPELVFPGGDLSLIAGSISIVGFVTFAIVFLIAARR